MRASTEDRERRDGRDKPPSKDGTAQRTAKEVEGLKDYVGTLISHTAELTGARMGVLCDVVGLDRGVRLYA